MRCAPDHIHVSQKFYITYVFGIYVGKMLIADATDLFMRDKISSQTYAVKIKHLTVMMNAN